MKKLLMMAVVGLSMVATASFADSCKSSTNFPAGDPTKAPDAAKTAFCGCYGVQQRQQCNTLREPVCTLPAETIAHLTYGDIKTTYQGDLTAFCKDQVDKLNKAGDKGVTYQDCNDDVGLVINSIIASQGATFCNGFWPKS